MSFAASLQPCPGCAARDLGELDFRSEKSEAGTRWTASAPCRACGAVRSFAFTANGDPTITRRGRFDLGPGRSALLSPEELLAAFDEAVLRIPAFDALTRAVTCVTELLKMVPGQDPLPGAKDERLARKPLEAEYLRIRHLLVKHAPPNTITDAMTAGHDAWLARGAKGAGRIVIEGKRLVGERYDSVDWTLSRIADTDLTDAALSDARLQLAELERVVFTGATVARTLLAEAHITGGTWTHANLSVLRLNGAVVKGTDFTASDMERADFTEARVTSARFDGVRFGTAVFDRAVFQDCSFRGASFALFSAKPEPTSADAQFVDCDLTDTDWTDRDLSNTAFVRCKLAGAHGKPKATKGLVLVRCDVDTSTFVKRLGSPPGPKTERPLVDVIRELVQSAGPRSVGAIFEELGVTLDASVLEASGATGTIVLPPRALDISRPRFTVRYTFDAKSEAAVTTPNALRDRPLVAFSIVCLPKDAVDAALRARFGDPSEIAGGRGDDLRVFGRAGAPGWVQTARSAVVAWFSTLPDWLAAPAEPEARRAALQAILAGVRGAASFDELRAVVAGLPVMAGVASRAGHAQDHVELTFVPPIPAKQLENALVLQSVVAIRDEDGTWILRRLANAKEEGKTASLTLGTWPILPRLTDAPAGGHFDDASQHAFGPLDAVASMRIGVVAASSAKNWEKTMSALVEAPPRTVGELTTAVGIALDGVDLAAAPGRLTLPGLTARYEPEGGAPATVDALRARRIVDWTAELVTGLAGAESVLAARFGEPIALHDERRYGPWAVRPAADGAHDAGAVLHRAYALAPESWYTTVAARPDGARIAIGDAAGRVRIWSPAEARETACHLLGARILTAAWTHDGGELVVIHERTDVLRVFSGDGTKHLRSFSTRHGVVAAVAMHPTRNVVATTGADGVVRIWDLATTALTRELDAEAQDEGTAIAMSEAHVAAGFRSGGFVSWEMPGGERIASGEIFGAYVGAMAFSPDGASLLCGGGAGSLAEIRTATWSAGAVWKGTPPKPIATNAIAFDRERPNGRFLCAHSDDTATLFSSRLATSPEHLGTPFHLERKRWEQAYIVSGACFVPHTRIILTSHFTGRLRVWQEDEAMTWKIGEVTFDHDGPKVEGGGLPDAKEWWATKSARAPVATPGAPVAPAAPPKKAPAADIVRLGDRDRRARSTQEMSFAASLHPCATCGGPIGKTDLQGGEDSYVLFGACPFCSRARSFVFVTEGYPLSRSPPRREIGDARPSRVIRPAELFAELARVAGAIEAEPTKLAPAAWRANASALDRALTCTNELLKFIPGEAAAIADADLAGPPSLEGEPPIAERATRAWLTGERDRLLEIDARALADVGRIWEITQGTLPAGDEIRALVYQAYPRVPSAADLRAYFETRRVKAVKPQPDGVVVELGDGAGLASARLWDDARGAHAEVVMRGCKAKDLADAMKPYGTLPDLVINTRKVSVTAAELDGDFIRRVLVSFPRPGAPIEPRAMSPGTAYLLAYLPARRLAQRAQRGRLERHAGDADAQLAHAIASSRQAVPIEDSIVAAVDERLAKIASAAGVELPPMPPATGGAGPWVAAIAAAVRPHLTTPVLEAAWRAGESARGVAVAIAVAAHLAHLRCVAPHHVELRAQAGATARGLTDSAASLKTHLEATGLPLARAHADSVAQVVRLTGDLEPATVAGYDALDRLARELDALLETTARQLELTP
jgi:uncharacterized protein YjbI with pentapeptide repeats